MDQTLVIRKPSVTDRATAQKFQTFKDELLRHSSVQQIAFSSRIPGEPILWERADIKLGNRESEQRHSIKIIGIRNSFLDVYDLKLLAGRNFSNDFETDNEAMLLSKKASELLGFVQSEDALDQKVFIGNRQFHVVGVVEDYHHLSLNPNDAIEIGCKT